MNLGLSCEIPSEQPAKYCEHGRFTLTCEFCLICSMQHKINLLESQMKSLTDLCNYMNMRIYNLSEHKTRQVDEDRKITRRVDECVTVAVVYTLRQTIETWQQGCEILINKIYERLEKLESYMEMEDRITASSVLLRLNELENHKLKNKPHKCPVCDGNRTIQTYSNVVEASETRFIDNLGRHFINCKSCDGRGIVWS